MNKLKLVILGSAIDLGNKVNYALQRINKTSKNYQVSITENRFSNGEGKVRINENVNNADLYILSDVGNYGISYQMHGREHFMSPDEHYEDIKRVIAATSGHAAKINVFMPLLYESRQHKRRGHESLDCAIALQELQGLGVNSILTFDAHDPSICNAIPRLPFENFYPTHIIVEELITNEELSNVLVVSPDMGAMERARYYADMLGCDVGVFYKRRDLTQVINGKNPIIEHMYMGEDPKGKDIIVVDDMIASGGSMLEVAADLKKRGARNIYLIATFSLFTEGTEKFIHAHDSGLFTKVYSTNLSYIPDDLKKLDWFVNVDCSEYIANIIQTLNRFEDTTKLCAQNQEVVKKIKLLKRNG